LLQEKLDKKYELRVFFLNEEFYAMAIFSQNASDTSVDFRNYKDKKQNRTVPYTLPYNIHVCLLKFVKETNLNTGSIDIVVTTDNRFVFLEVNPVGQFGMVSYPCNYHLEKKVATYLSHE
jgi:glutathione synthase/RimK-type ligase-like ATP-grasp enzyme